MLDRDDLIADILDRLLEEARWEAQQNLNDHIISVAWAAGVDLEDVEHWDEGTPAAKRVDFSHVSPRR